MEANQTPADYKFQGDIFFIPVKIKQIPYLRVKSLSQQKHKKMEQLHLIGWTGKIQNVLNKYDYCTQYAVQIKSVFHYRFFHFKTDLHHGNLSLQLMRITLCLLVILAVASATTKFNLDYSKKRSITAVLAEVEAKLKNKSPLEAILNVLRDFRDAVNTEQVSHDEIYNIQQVECASENQFRSAEVQDASNVLRDSTAALNVAQTSKIRATNQQEVNQQQYFSAQEHLTSVQTSAEGEAGYFKKRGRDYEDALHAIDEASDILASIYSGSGSFLEISRVAKSMLQTAFSIKETTRFAPIFYAFAQLATQEGQLDESALERVAQLLETLRANIQEAYNDYAESNAVSVAAFNDQKERLGQTIARLEAQNERLQNKLDSLNQQIGSQSAIAQRASGKLQRNQQLWDQAQALCSTFANEYNFATQARRNEIQLVAQLEELVESRFNQVEDENHERNQRIASLA